MGELYEGKIMRKMGYDIILGRILPRVPKIGVLPLKIAQPYPLTPCAKGIRNIPFLFVLFHHP